MKRRIYISVLACAVLLICLGSCTDSGDFYLGNGKDKDTVRDEIFGENAAEDNEPGDNSNVGAALPEDAPQKVYFTESGSVWHTRRDCSHIRNSASVIEGPLSEAFDKGKTKQCSSCLAADESDNEAKTDETEGENVTDEVQNVFWLNGGSVWHGSAECSYISDKAELQSGSIDGAKAVGIENPCSRCAKDKR